MRHAVPDRDHAQEVVAGQEREGRHRPDGPVLEIRLLDPVVRLHVRDDHGLALDMTAPVSPWPLRRRLPSTGIP